MVKLYLNLQIHVLILFAPAFIDASCALLDKLWPDPTIGDPPPLAPVPDLQSHKCHLYAEALPRLADWTPFGA